VKKNTSSSRGELLHSQGKNGGPANEESVRKKKTSSQKNPLDTDAAVFKIVNFLKRKKQERGEILQKGEKKTWGGEESVEKKKRDNLRYGCRGGSKEGIPAYRPTNEFEKKANGYNKKLSIWTG